MQKRILFILSEALVLLLCACNSSDYKNAQTLYQSGDYAAACQLFEALSEGDEPYKDSEDMVSACRYQQALALENDGSYSDAITAYTALGSYEDCKDRIKACKYSLALALEEAGEYEKAAEAFTA